ncbi:hypothetical protein HD806DRAFT_531863 [Xylariaceae sp. AK1471]|nr:hypothetical protein HD806DRAFT_531863 [Xylariaceae sp. AK1471]
MSSGSHQGIIEALWAEASIQLDNHSSIIRITASSFDLLGKEGEAFFIEQARQVQTVFIYCNSFPLPIRLTTNLMEFFTDSTNNNRVYLANAYNLTQTMNVTIDANPGMRLRTLSPIFNAGNNMNTGSSVNQGLIKRFMSPPHTIPSTAMQFHTSDGLPQCGTILPLQYPPVYPYNQNMLDMEYQSMPAMQSSSFSFQMPTQALHYPVPPPPQFDTSAHHTGSTAFHCKRVKEEYNCTQNGQVSKILGDEWKGLSEAEQKPWRDEANRLKAEHALRHPNWRCNRERKKPKGRQPKKQKIQGQAKPRAAVLQQQDRLQAQNQHEGT